jgi:DNA-binding transcriptional ArsR family regulator
MALFDRFGLKENPYSVNPITYDTLELFVGRKNEIKKCALAADYKSIIVVEGGRGVGTTSFGNYVRFNRLKKRKNFTLPREISVERGWNGEFLLANTLSWLVRSLEDNKKTAKKPKFREIKKATHGIQEIYRQAGLQLMTFGTHYGKEAAIATPPVYPIATLIQYFEDCSKLIKKIGYNKPTIIQINNLDLDTTISAEQLRFFLNDIRDLLQIPGYSWLLIGDSGLSGFMRLSVDRLADIVTFETHLKPLTLKEVHEAINKRIEFLKTKEHTEHPISDEVINMLYNASHGRIRKIFRAATNLLHLVEADPLINRVDMEVAIPLIKRVTEDKIGKAKITYATHKILEKLVILGPITPTELSKKIKIQRQAASRALIALQRADLAYLERKGKEHFWDAEPEVKIALKKTHD